jgi:hypothetical protein
MVKTPDDCFVYKGLPDGGIMWEKKMLKRNIIRIDRVLLLCRIRRQKTFGHLVVKITFRVVAEARWPAKIMDHSRRVLD